MNRIQTKGVATFAGLVFLVWPLLRHLAWGKCNLEAVVGSDRNYTFSLWGARIMRSCPVGDQFDSQTCRCNAKATDTDNIILNSPVTYVYGGSAESGPKPNSFPIKWAKVQKFHYDVEKYGDIMMLQLDRGMSQWRVLAPINFLPDRSYVGHICMVVGFGAQSVDHRTGKYQFDGHLYDAEVEVLAKYECYIDSWKDDPNPICVKPTDSSRYTCSGDSGGGLVCRDIYGQYGLLGVLSKGIGYCGGGGASGQQTLYAAAPPFNNGLIASYFADPDPGGRGLGGPKGGWGRG